jgi:hypothetical protein
MVYPSASMTGVYVNRGPSRPTHTKRQMSHEDAVQEEDGHDLDFGFLSLQNCGTINLCCFKPPSLWSFVTVALGNNKKADFFFFFFFFFQYWGLNTGPQTL